MLELSKQCSKLFTHILRLSFWICNFSDNEREVSPAIADNSEERSIDHELDVRNWLLEAQGYHIHMSEGNENSSLFVDCH